MSQSNLIPLSALLLEEAKPPELTRWQWNAKNQTLIHIKRGYEVDFESMTTSAQCLDWIFQVFSKTWADHNSIVALLAAIKYYVDPQGHLCSYGCEHGRG